MDSDRSKLESGVAPAAKIRRLVYKMSSELPDETSSKHSTTIPKAIRGNYDGKLSVAGIVLRIIYFVLFLIAIYFDHRFERIERWARILPKLFGVFLLGFQLVGVIPRYRCDSTSWRTFI